MNRPPDKGFPPGSNHLPQVREQYEVLPYPPRNPADERQRLIHRTADNLIHLNHHCFAGARDFRANFRVLVAGGGTGDSTVYLAEQLRGFSARIVHLDFSAASMALAQARARERGLDNITWVHASLMDLPGLGLGRFDYINCTGVLHHLESSEAGLRILAEALEPDGAMLLMLYGRYGRRSVYNMQELLQAYLSADMDIPDKIRMTRQLLGALPPTNGFVRDADRWQEEISPQGLGDAGLYDLLLHSRDRSFDVPALYALTDSASLDLLAFVDRALDYDPRTHLSTATIATHLDGLDTRRRQAIAELMVGDLNSHEFYVGHRGRHRAAGLDDERNALVLMGKMHGHHHEIGTALAPGRTVTFAGRGGTATVAGNAVNRVLFAHADSMTPLSQVYERVLAAVPGVDPGELRRGVQELLRTLTAQGHLALLQAGSYGVKVPDYARLPPPQ